MEKMSVSAPLQARSLFRAGSIQRLADLITALPEEDIAQIEPDCLDATINWFAEQGNFSGAVRLCVAAKAAGLMLALPRPLAQRMIQHGQWSEAVSLLQDWGDVGACNADHLAQQVVSLQAIGASQAAARLCRQARANYPQDSALALSQVITSLRLGQRDAAIETLQDMADMAVGPVWVPALLRGLLLGQIDAMGLSLEVPPDLVSPTILLALARGNYESGERDALLSDLRPDDRILELGTGLGAMACWASQHQPTVTILTVEANPALAPVIARNFHNNACLAQAITGIAALQDGKAAFHIAANFWASSQFELSSSSQATTLNTVNVARLMEEFHPSLLVVDIEGAETKLLPHLPLNGVRRIIVEMHPDLVPVEDCADVWRRLLEEGFYPQQAQTVAQVVIWDRIAGS